MLLALLIGKGGQGITPRSEGVMAKVSCGKQGCDCMIYNEKK